MLVLFFLIQLQKIPDIKNALQAVEFLMKKQVRHFFTFGVVVFVFVLYITSKPHSYRYLFTLIVIRHCFQRMNIFFHFLLFVYAAFFKLITEYFPKFFNQAAGEDAHTQFELSDNIYANATIVPDDKVSLWLGVCYLYLATH